MGRQLAETQLRWSLEQLGPKKIIDIGGAWNPTSLSTHIFDIEEQRGRCLDNTWIRGDICQTDSCDNIDDNEFDFAICTHTLEDIYDPVTACKNLSRIAKAGYIECPNFFAETFKFVLPEEIDPAVNGYIHHKYIMEAREMGVGIMPEIISPEWKDKPTDLFLIAIPKSPRVLLTDFSEEEFIPNMRTDPRLFTKISFFGLFWCDEVRCFYSNNEPLEYIKQKRKSVDNEWFRDNYYPIHYQSSFREKYLGG